MKQKLEGIVREYREYFKFEHAINGKLTVDDKPIEMHPLEAIGEADDIDVRIPTILQMAPEQIHAEAITQLHAGFINIGFFYYFVSQLLRGKSIEDMEKSAMLTFDVTDSPFVIHQLHPSSFSPQNQTCFFLDWDDTVRIGNEIRRNMVDFIDHFYGRNRSLNFHKYTLAITSASYDLGKKTSRHSKLLQEIDAIYTIPGIGKLVDGWSRVVSGKLYTHICRTLGIDYFNSIIFTDTWADKSVDKTYPITTIVTAPDVSAASWIRVVEYFESKGRTIADASDEIKRRPLKVFEIQSKKGIKLWKAYHVGGDLYLFRNPDMPGSKDCYFLVQGEYPRDIPEVMRKAFML